MCFPLVSVTSGVDLVQAVVHGARLACDATQYPAVRADLVRQACVFEASPKPYRAAILRQEIDRLDLLIGAA